MTREEAIMQLNLLFVQAPIVPNKRWGCKRNEALSMAIEALSADAVHIETYRELYEKYVELKHASAEAVQGEWKHTITWQPYCSNCEYVFGEDEEFSPFWNYCPMCGARMKGGGDE